jgi:L-ascorbate metabolism protein UlaG (beta-lactamase superfamily)
VTQENKTVNLVWLGTAGVLLEDGDTGILIDPYVSRFGILKIALGLPLLPDTKAVKKWSQRLGKNNIKAVIVSHSHFDHSLDAPYFVVETDSVLIGSESTINVGRGASLKAEQLTKVEPDQNIQVGSFTLKFIESLHGPALLGRIPYPGTIDKPLTPPRPARDYKLGKTYAILISHPSGTIMHHGSAGFVPGMYDGIKTDVVLLGIAGRGNTQEYLNNVPLKLGAKLVIPVHFDNFFVSLEKKKKNLPGVKLKEFLATAENYRGRFELKLLPIGEKTAILPANNK